MASASAPLNYFLHAHGPAAGPTMLLGWIFASIAVATCCIVAVLLWMAIRRRRENAGAGADALVQGGPNGLKWVAIGTGISSAILLGMTVYALAVLNQVAARPAGPVLDVTVTAYDWWWRIDYPAADGVAGFVTANELHIPVGMPVRLRLESADVIHAFWVPQLAGKTQAIPALHNEQWLQADRPGVYAGQCTQYCGVQHAHMAFEVVAEPPARYAAWKTAQALPAANLASAGSKLFSSRCGGCHTVRGSAAAGEHGPDLTHLINRRTIAAGALANTPENLMTWITHAQAVKPGNRMPSMALDDAEAAQLGAYLASLQ
jgi:cytochrome c oxidase subunit 2